jgi:hypothetical protein
MPALEELHAAQVGARVLAAIMRARSRDREARASPRQRPPEDRSRGDPDLGDPADAPAGGRPRSSTSRIHG